MLPPAEKNKLKFLFSLVVLILLYVLTREKLISFLYTSTEKIIPYPRYLESLEEKIAYLKAKITLLKNLETENRRLKKLLELKDDKKRIIICKVLEINPSYNHREILIDKGKKEGLRKGMYVFEDSYLIGQIVEVYPRASRVLLINDIQFYLPVYVKTSLGKVSSLLRGNLKGELELDFVEDFEKIKVGDKIYTLRFRSVLPDLYMGKVSLIDKNRKIVKISPLIDLEDLDFVIVYE